MKTPAFALDHAELHRQLSSLCDSEDIDERVKGYYRSGGEWLWMDRTGKDSRPDTLLFWLRRVGELGMTERSFAVAAIEDDVRRVRQLDFDGQNTATQVFARLELRLTNAYLRYVSGQRFGFVNPYAAFNRLDIQKADTLRRITSYRKLYGVDIEQPGPSFVHAAFDKVRHDSVGEMLREVQPTDPVYARLQQELSTASAEQRQLILCNMERCRWRMKQPMVYEGKRIIVNIPAFHLFAYSSDSVFEMKVGCGTVKTKTPQLTSAIEWMEVNPNWNIPMSIIETDVARHAGDTSYFARHRYFIAERSSGDRLPIESVSRSMLLSGKYRVSQEGGAGNSLGRLIFRFKNEFQVFLHDTSTRAFFERGNRGVSHGCVRVERPFDLAKFVLNAPDEWLLDRMRISMGMPPITERGINYLRTHRDEENKLVSWVPVNPHVPLYIIYYTRDPDAQGNLQTYPDVYGFDRVIWQYLQPYMK